MRSKDNNCREWRESLGAFALGHLDPEQRAGIEAHLEGCPACRAELASLDSIAGLLPLADPARLGRPAPQPPAELGERVLAAIGDERQGHQRRRRFRFGLALSGATAALAAAVLAIFVLGSSTKDPSQHVSFAALPQGVKISAKLEPHTYGTQIHMYVSGIRSGTLCQVFLRGPGGSRVPAGTFRYRWGEDSDAVLSSALDLSRTEALEVQAGRRTFVAPVDRLESSTGQIDAGDQS